MKALSLERINGTAPYAVVETNQENAYRFLTDYGVDIAVAFDEDFLIQCGESYEFSITNMNRRISPRDNKVRDTIVAIIHEFFTANQAALLYLCETADQKQAMRNRLFASWFAAANSDNRYTILTACVEDAEGKENYAALVLRCDNPKYVDYVSEFSNTVQMFSIKPEHEGNTVE